MLRIFKSGDITAEQRAGLMKRVASEDRSAVETVRSILDRIEREGTSAVLDYTLQFDGVRLNDLVAQPEEFDAAENQLSDDLKRAFQKAAENIATFHQLQREALRDHDTIIDGTLMGFKYIPVDAAGVYVPGGKASYPSSVLMGLIPAIIAGVRKQILITPPNASGSVDPAVLYCARMAGGNSIQVIKAGGAQGIAAAAYGLTGIRTEVIVGPGNRYVMAAKSILTERGLIRMDMPAGPSEVIVIADESARPEFVAADLLSQAEHGEDSPAVLLTDSIALAEATAREIERGLNERPARRDMKATSIREHSFAVVFDDIKEAFVFSNEYGPEHLEICTQHPQRDLERITSAGSVFLGHYAPVALGDYFSGTNHVLPTGGAARFYSGLGVEHFLKRITYQYPTEESLRNALDPIMLMSVHEGLDQEHGHSVQVRFQDTHDAGH